MEKNRFFEVTITQNWIEKQLDYQHGATHLEVSKNMEHKNERILNPRFREIEKTGNYYRITEMCKGGKSFVFEILS